MEQRASSLQKHSDPVYWDALATLAILYEEADRKDLAAQKLSSMQEFLTAHSDPQRAAQLAALRKLAEQRLRDPVTVSESRAGANHPSSPVAG
jgi:hypothetical protein